MTTAVDRPGPWPGAIRRDTAGARPTLGAVDHLALSVTDLEASTCFYIDALGFVVVMAIPNGRICMHPATGFVLALLAHPEATRERFTELNTGVDHVGFAAGSRRLPRPSPEPRPTN